MTLNGVMALFCVISANSGSFRAHSVKFTFAISSPDEFLYFHVKLGCLTHFSLHASQKTAFVGKRRISEGCTLAEILGVCKGVSRKLGGSKDWDPPGMSGRG